MKRNSFFLIASYYFAQLSLFGQSGAIDPSFTPRIEAPSGDRTFIRAIALQSDGKILVGGRFETVDGVYRYRIARLDSDGSRDTTFPYVDPSAQVNALVIEPSGRIVFGGAFTTIGGIPQGYIARVNADGSLDGSFNQGGADNAVGAVAITVNGRVLVGGSFFSVNGTAARGIARLLSDGTVDTGFSFSSNMFQSTCQTFVPIPEEKCLIGGYFVDAIGGFSVARLNSDGTFDFGFTRLPTFGGIYTSALALQADGKILAGPDGVRLHENGMMDTSWQISPGPNRDVLAIAVQPDGKVIMAGSFTTYHGLPANRIVRLNTNGTVDLTFSASANTNINAIAWQPDGKVLIAGEFQNVNGTPRTLVARLLGDFPVLRSIPSGPSELTFSWPTAYTNYTLESASAVPSMNWQPVATSPVIVSNNWVFTNSIGPSNQFFRLSRN